VSGYCDYAIGDPLHGPYHDREYGFPVDDEAVLFERLIFEINQAGLSWALILRKQDGFRAAYHGFDVDTVAAYDAADVARLLADERIVRNRLKVNAAIHNARVIQSMRESHGGFAGWIASHHPKRKPDWVKLFKKTFKFTGGEITGEFLMSIGYLPGAHRDDCPVQTEIAKRNPPWRSVPAKFWAA